MNKPIHLMCVFHITNICNLRCAHCYASAGEKLDEELNLSEIKEIIDDLKEIGTQYLIISGGEPFCNKNLFNILDYCNKKKIRMMITSNGTMITDSIAKRLKEFEYLDSLQISIDSHISEKHDAFRGVKGAFENAVRGVQICKKNDLKVSIMTTLSKFNISNLEEMLDFFVSLGVDGVALERFVPEGRGKNMKEEVLSSSELKRGLSKIVDLRKENKNIKIWSNDPLLQFLDPELSKLTEKYKNNTEVCGGCSAGITGTCITPDGFITPCTRFYKKIANLRKDSIKNIWENNEMLNKLRDRKKNLKGKCGLCEFANVCGGCRAAAYYTHGDICAEDPSCWVK